VILATADSNIYVSALQFGGIPREFLNAARAGSFKLAISNPIISEIRGVLLEKFRWSEDILDESVGALLDFAELVYPGESLRIVIEDPDDDRVLECEWSQAHSSLLAEINTYCG